MNYLLTSIITTITVGSLSGGAMAQTFLNWNTLRDTSGNLLGDAASGQVFDLDSGRNITVSWSGNWTNGAPQGFAGADALNGVEFRADQGESISITFATNFTDVWTLESQRNNTGIDNRDGTGVLTADGNWNLTNLNTITDLTGDGTNVITYNDPPTGDRGDFDVTFTGNTFTYDYSVQTGFATPNVHESFRFALNQVPEPSSTMLVALGGLGLLLKRKR